MKKNFTQTFLALITIALFYSACKKSEIKTKTDTTDFKQLSSQIATTFYKSITGQYGSVDVSKGIKSPFKTAATGRGLSLNSIPSLCGFAVDTAYSYNVFPNGPGHIPSPTDTGKQYYGKFHFVYTCDAGVVNGYNVIDSVAYSEGGLDFSNSSSLGQNYIVKALDQTYKLVSMDGSIYSSNSRFRTGEEIGSFIQTSYFLTGLKVDFSTGIADIIAGTATFHMLVSPPTSVASPHNYTNYYGTITYLGNHKAKLTINPGQVYLVDLITGVATPV